PAALVGTSLLVKVLSTRKTCPPLVAATPVPLSTRLVSRIRTGVVCPVKGAALIPIPHTLLTVEELTTTRVLAAVGETLIPAVLMPEVREPAMWSVRPPRTVIPPCGANGQATVPPGVPVMAKPRRITSWLAGALTTIEDGLALFTVALAPVASMVIALVIVRGPKDPLSNTLIWPPVAVLSNASANVRQGAVREQGLASLPVPETQVRVAPPTRLAALGFASAALASRWLEGSD